MLLQMLKSKLKEVIVTSANTEYEGSITLDPELMDAAELQPYERVEVNAVNGTARIVTYVIKGNKSGQVELNGGAANFFNKGDHIHVNCFGFAEEVIYIGGKAMDYSEVYGPLIIKTDENNKVI